MFMRIAFPIVGRRRGAPLPVTDPAGASGPVMPAFPGVPIADKSGVGP